MLKQQPDCLQCFRLAIEKAAGTEVIFQHQQTTKLS